MTLSPVECWLVSVILLPVGLVIMLVGGALFWVGWALDVVSSWYMIQSLTREWVYTDDDFKKME